MLYKYIVENSTTVKEYLSAKGFSNRVISKLKAELGLIRVNKIAVNIASLVNKNDVLEIIVKEKCEVSNVATKAKLDLLYDDEYFSIVSKPPNVESVEGRNSIGESLLSMYQNTITNMPKFYGENNSKNREDNCGLISEEIACNSNSCIPRVVTRLDKGTSGVVIIAKSAHLHNLFARLISQNRIVKTYFALVYGNIQDNGIIDKNIAREEVLFNGRPSVKRIVCGQNIGQRAITSYQVLCHYKGYTLLKVTPQTGRTHQIRVHLASIGHSIVGDKLYQSNEERAKSSYDNNCKKDASITTTFSSISENMVGKLENRKLKRDECEIERALILERNESENDLNDVSCKSQTALENTAPRILTRQALHAFSYSFAHPVTNRVIEVEDSLSKDILDFIEILER